MENPNFLVEKYADLPGSKAVDSAVKKSIREGNPGPAAKQGRVDAYLSRLEKLTTKKEGRSSERGRPLDEEKGFHLLKNKILNKFAIDVHDKETVAKIAEGLYQSEKRIAIEQGRGADIEKLGSEKEIIEKYKPLISEKAEIQRKTLSSWLDYLQENDAMHPMWFRYFVVRSLDKMGVLDKEKGAYSKRTSHTVAPFPELNSEALGWVYNRLKEGIEPEDYVPRDEETLKKKETLAAAIKAKDFAKLYAIAQMETAGKLNRESIEGEWRKYDKGGDYHQLEKDLKGKGTGWCTAEGSAEGHLEAGDFYVYFSKSPGGFTEPRVAIRMEGDSVAEVRGVNQRQELEPELVDIAQAQYHQLPGGEAYDKKADDMKRVTELSQKQEKGEQFTKDDLIFLYEIKAPIEGFGYDKDPRVKQLRDRRDPKADAPIVLECAPSEIAYSKQEINEDTKAYIGPLFKNIFKKIGHLEHIYTIFPERKIRPDQVAIDGTPADQMEAKINQKGFQVGSIARKMMDKISPRSKAEDIHLIRLSVGDLGFTGSAKLQQIIDKAKEFGLEICPPEVGPHYRVAYDNQPMNEYLTIAMETISDSGGYPSFFNLYRDAVGVWLYRYWALPGSEWFSADEFVFRLRK